MTTEATQVFLPEECTKSTEKSVDDSVDLEPEEMLEALLASGDLGAYEAYVIQLRQQATGNDTASAKDNFDNFYNSEAEKIVKMVNKWQSLQGVQRLQKLLAIQKSFTAVYHTFLPQILTSARRASYGVYDDRELASIVGSYNAAFWQLLEDRFSPEALAANGTPQFYTYDFVGKMITAVTDNAIQDHNERSLRARRDGLPEPTPLNIKHANARMNELPYDREPWMDEGTCSKPETKKVFAALAYGKTKADIEKAKTYCIGCPVVDTCLEFALDLQVAHGVWGAKSPRERKRLLKRRQAKSSTDQNAEETDFDLDTL